MLKSERISIYGYLKVAKSIRYIFTGKAVLTFNLNYPANFPTSLYPVVKESVKLLKRYSKNGLQSNAVIDLVVRNGSDNPVTVTDLEGLQAVLSELPVVSNPYE